MGRKVVSTLSIKRSAQSDCDLETPPKFSTELAHHLGTHVHPNHIVVGQLGGSHVEQDPWFNCSKGVCHKEDHVTFLGVKRIPSHVKVAHPLDEPSTISLF